VQSEAERKGKGNWRQMSKHQRWTYGGVKKQHAKRLFILVIVLWAAWSTKAQAAWPAKAQAPCAPRAAVTDQLTERYSERRVARGLTGDGQTMIEVWASATGSWTILAIQPRGVACILSSGTNFEFIASKHGTWHD